MDLCETANGFRNQGGRAHRVRKSRIPIKSHRGRALLARPGREAGRPTDHKEPRVQPRARTCATVRMTGTVIATGEPAPRIGPAKLAEPELDSVDQTGRRGSSLHDVAHRTPHVLRSSRRGLIASSSGIEFIDGHQRVAPRRHRAAYRLLRRTRCRPTLCMLARCGTGARSWNIGNNLVVYIPPRYT